MFDEQPVETTLYSLASVPPAMPERRGEHRHVSLLRVGSLIIGERRELCLIRNVSAGGMLIRAYSKIASGSRLSVELRQGEPVHGTVLWAKQELVGVSFDKPIDIVSLLSTADGAPPPRMPRLEIQCIAVLRDGAKVHRTRAVNVSQGGLRLEGGSDLPTGAHVTVTLPGLAPEAGIVCWNDGESCGISFNRVLALPQLVAWVSEQQEERRAVG